MNVDNVKILSTANDTAYKVSPKIITNVVALVLGLIVAILIVALKEIFDKRIRNEEDIEKNWGFQY